MHCCSVADNALRDANYPAIVDDTTSNRHVSAQPQHYSAGMSSTSCRPKLLRHFSPSLRSLNGCVNPLSVMSSIARHFVVCDKIGRARFFATLGMTVFLQLLTGCVLPRTFPPPPRVVSLREPLSLTITVAPFAIAPELLLHSWSPDGRYVAFWQFDVAGLPPNPNIPTRLRFYDVKERRLCEFPYQTSPYIETGPYATTGWFGTVEDFDFMANLVKGGPASGLPCKDFGPSDWPSGFSEGEFSPNNAAWANTIELSRTNGIITLQTIIDKTPGASSTPGVTFTWSIDERLGDLGMGGQWLSDQTFLIYETREVGPVLLKTAGENIPLIPELTGGTKIPRSEVYAIAARGETYHILLLTHTNQSPLFAPRLYHGNTNRTEALPSQFFGGQFSANGQWLLLRANDGLWLRSADTQNATPRQISPNADSAPLFSPDETQILITDEATQNAVLLDLPSLKPKARWQLRSATHMYIPTLYASAWSPDGKSILIHGSVPGRADNALFILTLDK